MIQTPETKVEGHYIIYFQTIEFLRKNIMHNEKIIL